MSDLQFTINGKSINATKFTDETRQFSHTLDEPAALGGADDGANPMEFILAGYAG
jgi:uncharacterized OsmC-like protein